ncbi:MAG: two-component system response regulator [Bdellovibrionales bacterium GWC1_52_8]|nr:MAG: two-component system response regulator [Bdellovibrionales bacterium GWB1_52_6]OFZ02524.1 MAG: two-component system response regulator [Bdellovibrionales bacterium GWA1_52_35]OFZ36612.1 MAG: two-component system response regulator [Bdellovibrionales bacterium GWC1_52_8]HCM41370.1 sigma-54-dependent Fis family transcriptional regulator [Bdellovibrionales bacterium]
MFKVLVVDDDADLRLSVASALSENNYIVDQAKDGEEAVNRIRASRYDLVLLDVSMPRMTGLEALKEIKAHDPSIIAIMLTAFSNVRDAVEATKEGAYNYLEKPVKAENLVYIVDRALKAQKMIKNMSLSAPVLKLPNGTDFIGQSSDMKRIFGVIDKLSRVDTAVLIRGESGTGKELVAQALHFNGPRKDNRFVTINCSAIPETLIESEFFGHEKGAFTGADSRKIGKFQYADGGTLFLDEIGDITAGMQVKLLRVLQEKKFTPVGANREVEVNVRIVAATNRHLEEMVKKGEFREDLFYRLNVLPIQLPTLRERKNDIDALVTYFIEKFNQQHKKNVTGLSPEAMELVKAHNWPGNIRELENVIEHAFVIESGNTIMPASLPSSITRIGRPGLDDDEDELSAGNGDLDQDDGDDLMAAISVSTGGLSPLNVGGKGFTLDINRLDFQANKEEFERQFLISALTAFKGRINQTALHANIPKKTLLRKLQKYGITAKDYSGRIT